jgi:hypothetical protein
MNGWANLLSGLIGAVIGSGITVVVQIWLERTRRTEEAARLRSEVALAVIEWLQDTWQYLSLLTTQKTLLHVGALKDKDLLTDDEYRALSLELRKRMLHDALRARVAIVFGDGDELALLSAIQDGIRAVVRAAWGASAGEWPKTAAWIEERMKALGGTRNTLEQRLIALSRLPQRTKT